MKAAIIDQAGGTPYFGDFKEAEMQDGSVMINVETAGLGGWDILGAYQLGMEYPCVLRGEGVGRKENGQRVYFGERANPPFGAWAERVCVPFDEVWNVPDEVSDEMAITMAIAGTGAIVPLEQANIAAGDNVLIVGATGAIGQIALQLARIMGAGHVVAAARSEAALSRLVERGIADAAVVMDGVDDVAELTAQSNGGFDVVLDMVCGPPLHAAMKATRWGARIVTIGIGAGDEMNFNIRDLLFRSLSLVGTGQRSPQDREQIWLRLLDMALKHNMKIDTLSFPLSQVSEAWDLQASSPHAKVIGKIVG